MVKKMRMTGYEWTYTHKQKIPREGITHCILITLLSKSCEPKNGESSKNKVRKIGNGLIKMQTHYLHCNFFHYTKVGIRFSALIIRNQIFYICLSFTPVSMLYRPVWILCIILYRVFFKHFIIKENKVDLSKPTIFISNHNNAFIDPIVYAATILSRMYFIVRGDIFNTPVKRWFLWNLGQIPMFRIRDGIDNVKRNESSFEQSYDLLGNNENILIFPEADCVQKKRLRGLKKGTARMAFGAVTKHGWDIDLQILPVMNNYTYPREFRTEVMTNVGEPICLNDYREIYEKDENQALTKLTKEMAARMKRDYIHIEHPENDDLFERLVIIARNDNPTKTIPWLQFQESRFRLEKSIADRLNEIGTDSDERAELDADTKQYLDELKSLNISDKVFAGAAPNLFFGAIVTLVGFPVYVFGILLNIFQFEFAKHIADKKIKQVIFQNSIRYGALLVTNLLVVLALMISVSFYNWKLALLTPFVLAIIAFFTINYHEYVQSWRNALAFSKLESDVKSKLLALRNNAKLN